MSVLGWASLLRSHGLTSFYSGALLLLFKFEAEACIYQQISKSKQRSCNEQTKSQAQAFTRQLIGGILAFFIGYPLDTLVTRAMANPDSSTFGTLSNVFSSNGVKSLYNGFGIGLVGSLAYGELSLASGWILQNITSKLFVNYPGRLRLGALKWIFGTTPIIGTYFLDTIMRELMLSTDRTDLVGFGYAKSTLVQSGISSIYGGCLFYLAFSAIQTFTLGFIDVVTKFKFPR